MLRILRKFDTFLDKNQKRKLLLVILLMIIAAVFETLGVSMIVPIVTAITDPNFLSNNQYAAVVCKIFGIGDATEFIIFMFAAFAILYLVKGGFLFFENWVQQRFLRNNQVRLQKRLMGIFLHRPYEYYLNISSGEVIQLVVNDVGRSYLLLGYVMQFFSEGIVTIALSLVVFIINPLMASLVAVVLVAEMLLIMKALRKKLAYMGTYTRKVNSRINKWMLQAIEGIKATKIGRKEGYFHKQYSKYATENSALAAKYNVMNNLPKVIIESVTVAAMMGIMIIMMKAGNTIESLLPVISAFAVAAVRLLPSANRISAVINSIPYYEPNLDEINKNIAVVEQARAMDENIDAMTGRKKQIDKGPLSFTKNCGLKDIVYCYPNVEKPVLDGASMEIPYGKSVGIVGTTGAGKTTAVDVLLGLLTPESGTVYCDDVDIQENYIGWLKSLSYIPQTIYLMDTDIAHNVAYGEDDTEIDEERILHALEEAQLLEFINTLPEGIHTQIGERGIRLSGGQRQRIGIARALYNDPELLILDEATSSLDNETEAAIMDAVEALHGKKTLIIIAHRLTTIEKCDMVYRVESGKINRER